MNEIHRPIPLCIWSSRKSASVGCFQLFPPSRSRTWFIITVKRLKICRSYVTTLCDLQGVRSGKTICGAMRLNSYNFIAKFYNGTMICTFHDISPSGSTTIFCFWVYAQSRRTLIHSLLWLTTAQYIERTITADGSSHHVNMKVIRRFRYMPRVKRSSCNASTRLPQNDYVLIWWISLNGCS